MNDKQALMPLADWLQAGAQELARAKPPPERAAATLAAMQQAFQQQRQQSPGGTPWWRRALAWTRPLAWSGAATCASLLVGAVLLLNLEPQVSERRGLQQASSAFVPLVSSERWAGYMQENMREGAESPAGQASTAWVVATEMPRERLALLGLPYDPSQAGESVRAELLMHASGDVLAVRLVR